MKTTTLHETEETRGLMFTMQEIKSLLTVIAYSSWFIAILLLALVLENAL